MQAAQQAGDLKRQDYARKHAAALAPRLAKLVISAQSPPPAGLVLTWGDSQVGAEALGVDLYLDPGTREISASAPGFEPFVRTVELVQGKTTDLVVPVLTLRSVAAMPTARATPAPTDRVGITARVATAPPTRRYLILGTGAAGVAALGVGVVFGVTAHAHYRDAKALCGAKLICAAPDYERGQQLIRNTRSNTTRASVLAVIGGLAIASSATLYLTRPRREASTSARIAPVVHDHGAGVVMIGEF